MARKVRDVVAIDGVDGTELEAKFRPQGQVSLAQLGKPRRITQFWVRWTALQEANLVVRLVRPGSDACLKVFLVQDRSGGAHRFQMSFPKWAIRAAVESKCGVAVNKARFRFRKIEAYGEPTVYLLTVKGDIQNPHKDCEDGSLESQLELRREIEFPILPWFYEQALFLRQGNVVIKDRYILSEGPDWHWLLDVFCGALAHPADPLMIAELECKSVAAISGVTIPEVLGVVASITHDEAHRQKELRKVPNAAALPKFPKAAIFNPGSPLAMTG